MAQENVGININVQSNGEKALGSLKQQLREATAEVQALSEKFGATSQQAVEAAKRASELKDQIGDSKNLIDAFNPDTKFKAFSQTLGAVAGGFAAVQGALGLLGAEGEDVQKTLAKVQSALALSQGLEQLGDLGDAFKNLKTVAVDAFKGIKAAIGSSGIGLLVLALGAVVAYWDEIKAAVSGVSEEQKKLTEETNKNVKAQQDKLSSIDSQENILKLQGKSEREILGIKIKQTDEVIKATEQQIAQQKVVVKAQLEAEKRNKEILQGILRFLFAPISLILSTVDQVGKALGKDFNLEEKFSGGIAGLVFDPVETEKKGKETLAALDKSLNDLKNKRAGYQLSIQAIDKQAADKSAEADAARYQKILDDEKKLTEDLFAEYEKRKGIAVKAKILTQKELNALDAQDAANKAAKQKEVDDKIIADQTKIVNTKTNGVLAIIKAQSDGADAEIAIEKKKTQQKKIEVDLQLEAVMVALDAVAGIIDQNSVAGKAIAVAKAIINTYQGANQALAAYPPPFGAIAAVATVAAGLVNVKKIISTKVPSAKGTGSVGGGASAPSISAGAPIAPPQPQAQTTNISNQSINALGNQAIKTYVIESDVTSNQQRIAAIRQRARFG